jgi:hypothetical protein
MNDSVISLAGVTLVGLLALTGCGGGGSSSSIVPATNGTLTVGVSDAPVDNVTAICVEFEGASVKPVDGPAIDLDLEVVPDSCTNLLDFTGFDREILVDGFTLPAGEYEWMRFDVDAECDGDAMVSSHVVQDGGMVDLRVPSARGLQLSNGFVITANQATDFTIEWNMRMGLTDPVGQADCFKLKPSLRVVQDTEFGHITGTVSQPLLASDGPLACTSDSNTEAGNEVYLFASPDEVDDIDGIDDPYATAPVRFNAESSEYEYTVGYVEAGVYTVAFTCQGTDDVIPDAENPPPQGEPDPADNDITFTDGIGVTVNSGETATANFE